MVIRTQVVFVNIAIGADHIVSSHENVVGIPRGVSRAGNSHGLEDTAVAQLLDYVLWIEVIRQQGIIGLEATDIVRHGLIDARAKDL